MLQLHKRYRINKVELKNLIDDLRKTGEYSKIFRKAKYDRINDFCKSLMFKKIIH